MTLLVLVVMFVPWLGDTLFNTKGEPREAVVAVSMINSGNYILPESCGGDIPYKPPFLAWLIVAASWLTGGVTEFSSRLPSAVATILMAMGGYCFVRKYSRDFNDII
ncbi:MAG: dolichyl-phosphate-mannose--protein mannosyltransferase, partial [Duncaniella sp.]|nr:dolichyl-phosphate-mannose--protein mannosyltransferase [Duncaniella sp.]